MPKAAGGAAAAAGFYSYLCIYLYLCFYATTAVAAAAVVVSDSPAGGGFCGLDVAPRVHELWRFISSAVILELALLTLCSAWYAVRLHVVMPAFPGRRLRLDRRRRHHEHFD